MLNTPVDYSIVPANLKDLGALREIEQICFGADAWPLLDLISILTFAGIVRLKAVVNGKMAGFVGGDPHRDDGIGWITTICVRPEYRQMGIGSALLDKCERQMAQPTARLSVKVTNAGAIRLYEHKGYRQVDIWRRYYQDGTDALVLEKRLAGGS
jgi:ribosomal-protein-alanine N-acetyltransferase